MTASTDRPLGSDTIVATSSPAGRSPRAIVRLSGPDALAAAASIFRSRPPVDRAETYSSLEGEIALEPPGIRCPAAAYVMLAPRSYTREDIVELHTIGSPPLLDAMAAALMAAGARPAEPGEFTRRAFLNGRIDLTQAEAVQAIIHARSDAELRVGQVQLAGSFRDAVDRLRQQAADLLAEVEASIDFVDRDIEFIEPGELARRLHRLRNETRSLGSAEPAAPPKDGVVTAICGLPNAGKSSLLNALADYERAIVTHVPGTTRDTVEHGVTIDGTEFRLVDTAGMRPAGEDIEAEAIERANRAAESADLLLLVIDAGRPIRRPAHELWDRLTSRPGLAVITVVNKTDLPRRLSATEEGRFARRGAVVAVSARTGDGLDDLRGAMAQAARSGTVDRSAHPFWLGARHRAALRRAAESLGRAERAGGAGLGDEFVASDIRDALNALDEIVGRTTPDAILDRIFASFCIGK
ncbi:MAG: tRNA uridine-5-carboxymethylaminomethyl(34) synthesis GTPase MnmE [bacterium]